MKSKINLIIAVGVLVFIAMACSGSFTTANISSFNFGKNNTATPPTTSFDVSDKVYAVANVSGAMGKYKMRFKFENTSNNGVLPMTKDIDFEGSRPIYLELTIPTGGDYKVEATLLDETGKEVDKKSGTFNVKGGAPATTTEKPKSSSDSDKDKDADSDDK
jgi:hypothetical protein